MNVPSDQVNTPTYNRDLAAATKMLLESGASGLYNIGGSEARPPPPTQPRAHPQTQT
jgi:dTDP-4-dehydrorhamnose reductase